MYLLDRLSYQIINRKKNIMFWFNLEKMWKKKCCSPTNKKKDRDGRRVNKYGIK